MNMIDWTKPLETFGSKKVELIKILEKKSINQLTHQLKIEGNQNPWYCDENGCWNPGQPIIRNVPPLLVLMDKPKTKTCSRCKGKGYYSGRAFNLGTRTYDYFEALNCDMPGCHNGIVNLEENSKSF